VVDVAFAGIIECRDKDLKLVKQFGREIKELFVVAWELPLGA
jgi:hypothetical protein